MIIVRVELHSAITGRVTELARMGISNDGTSEINTKGHYNVETYRGRNAVTLAKRVTQRAGRVEGHLRHALHVWCLVAKSLKAMGYAD